MSVLDEFVKQVKEGSYYVGNRATELSTEAKTLLLDYAESVKNGKTVQTFDEYLQATTKAGKQVSADVVATSKAFLSTTETGKTISSAAGKIYDAASGAFKSSGNFITNNKVALMAGVGSMLALTAMQIPIGMAAIIGAVAAATGSLLGDKDTGFLKSFMTPAQPQTPAAGKDGKPAHGQTQQQAKTSDQHNYYADTGSLRPDTRGLPPAPEPQERNR